MRASSIRQILGALVLAVAATAARAEMIHIRIEKMAFVPAQISAHAGDTIEWTNADFLTHSATARSGAFDIMIPANGKATAVVNTAGTVDYYCKFHPNMTGQIMVGR